MKLPRLTRKVPVTDGVLPANMFARYWDQVCTAVENLTPASVTNTADVPVTGYVTITLTDGTAVKLAVVG